VESNITLTVDDLGGGGSGRFVFSNNNSAGSSVKILNVFLETGLSSIINNVAFDAVNSIGMVNFGSSGQPAPPGGNNLTPPWQNSQTFFTAKKSGSDANNIDGTEAAAFSFDFLATKTLNDIVNVILDNNSNNGRAAIHVGGLTGGASVSAVTTTVVPLPAAAWMGMMMLGGLGAIKKVRDKKLS